MKRFKVFITLILTSLCGCSSLLYYPDRSYHIRPDMIVSSPPQEIDFKNAEGVTLSGWYFQTRKKSKPKGLIVFFHGNAENLSTHFATLHWVLEEGYDYFIFDYEGYGKSQGKPSPPATVSDGKAALCWAFQKNPQVPLFIFGQSLGGAIALRTAIDVKDTIPIASVVVDSTFLSYKSVARSVLSNHWMTWLFQPMPYLFISDRFAPGQRVGEISPVPLLVFHGDEDQVVPYPLGKEVYDRAQEPKEFITISGGHHTDAFWRHGNTYRYQFVHWLDDVRHEWKASPEQIKIGLEYCSGKNL